MGFNNGVHTGAIYVALVPTSQYRHLSLNGTAQRRAGQNPRWGALRCRDAIRRSEQHLEARWPGFPGPGTLPTHHTARSVQVHHTLRQLVKPRQDLWLFFR